MMKNILIWNIQHLNSGIADSRKFCKNKNYLRQNFMNGRFLIVFMMALMFPTHSNTLEAESNKTRCSDAMTCTKCTIKPMCVWSLEQQACGNQNQLNSSSLIVSRIGECPRFSVVTTYQYNDKRDKTRIYVDNILKIANDSVGFMNYLHSSKIYMGIPEYNFQKPAEIINETDISYSFSVLKSSLGENNPAFTNLHIFYTIIKFNDIMLSFDNASDYYLTVYEDEVCANEKYKSCVTCGWNKNGYSNYLKWCSSESTCKVRNNLYLKNNATHRVNENVAYVTNDCAEINVTAIDPLSGPNTGGTTITIIVRNHKIFVENRTLKVTVAETVCKNPETHGLETITCTTSQVVGALSGPVLVEYSSIESVLKIESPQIFQFCVNPVLDEHQILWGVESGGTSVPIRGRHFVEPCIISSARMYVNLPDGVRWYADGYCDPPVNDTYIVCRSPRMNNTHQTVKMRLLNFGLDVINLTGNQSLYFGTTLSFYLVYPDPVLQDFVIDEAGSVVINGPNFNHLRLDDIDVQFLNSSAKGCVVVSIKLYRIECDPTTTIAPVELHDILVKIGDSLTYALANTSPTPIIDPFSIPVSEHPFILPDSYKTRCSDSMACTKCTIKPMCIWSLQQQTCGNRTQFNSSGLFVIRVDECPRFSVVKEYNYGESSVSLKYIVNLSNDLVGFRNYLKNSILYNRFPTYCKYPTQQINAYTDTIIACEFYVKKSDFDYNNPSFTFFTFIDFNNVMLRFDNVNDHYTTFYEKEECANDEKYKSCATCAWNNNGYSNYLRWCSSDNTCQVQKNLYMMNNGREQLNMKLVHLNNDCAEINVTAVDPLYGPKTGGTIVTITVRNHRIFAENRTVMVTIAETVCMNPRTSGTETITCTTSQFNKTLSGPILVEYSSIENVVKIESSQIFQFCSNPVLDAEHQLGGVASGGTSVSVRGYNFVEPCFTFLARLYVDLNDGDRRYADTYCNPPVNDTFMVCHSPKVNGNGWDGDASVVGRLLNFGLQITFNKDDLSLNQSLPIVVPGPSLRFYVHPDPVLLDFEIDKSGSLVVNGLHMQHVQPEDIVIHAVDSQSSVCAVVSVIRDGLVCEPNKSLNASQVISVTLGNSLVLSVFRKTDYPSKLPGWFIAVIVISTVLVFILALACFLRTKRRGSVTVYSCNPPEASKRSQDLYKNTAL